MLNFLYTLRMIFLITGSIALLGLAVLLMMHRKEETPEEIKKRRRVWLITLGVGILLIVIGIGIDGVIRK